jgi:DNA-binding NarL/FixJ family response regulator
VIRVVIADDQPLVREGFASILRRVDDIDLVGEATNGEEAVACVSEVRPDVVLMDIRMPLLDGIAATRRITADSAGTTRVIVLTTFDLDEYLYGALRAGASGFLLKDAPPEALVDAVRVVAGGEALLAPAVTQRLIERFAEAGQPDDSVLRVLTDREREVLVLVARGLSNAEIAEELFLSAATAKTHVSRVLAKLGARDRAQLVAVAYETGLVRPGTSAG